MCTNVLQLFCRYLLCNAVVEDENEYLNVLVAVNRTIGNEIVQLLMVGFNRDLQRGVRK